MVDHAVRLGVDIGGTFTDVVLEDAERRFSTKVLTTYDAPETAIIDGLRRVCEIAGTPPHKIGQIIHGTTLATNALIERRGAKTAFITTEGFRDVIEMRTESRFEQYDLNLQLPEPLLPRQRRYTVAERIDARGDVLKALNTDDVEALAKQLKAAEYESIAVGLLHSYQNDTHERQIADVLRAVMPDVPVSLSSAVSPQMREYERFNTVVANAYIKPLMSAYLGRLEGRLAAEGVSCDIFMMHSGGGIMSLETAAEFPVRLVESGPAGGAVFAAHFAASAGLDRVLSFDMGGTTAKICLIKDQSPKTARVFEVARSYRFKKGSGMPISIPVIDMVEIGAGGGSIAHVDSMRQIRVGPQSAGSEPGPACYGRGGTSPTVTDADLLLGKLDPDNFAGGRIHLSADASSEAVDTDIGSAVKVSERDAAFGISEVVDENMANAARMHAVENGEDLNGYTMIAFGGAAPLHAGRLCEKLGITRLLVPPGAGVGSAIGFLRAPFAFEATRSVYMRLSAFNEVSARDILSNLQREATAFVRRCAPHSDIECTVTAHMRYSGQGWDIPVHLTPQTVERPKVEDFQRLFEEAYTKMFSRPVAGLDTEITVWSVNAATPKAAVPEWVDMHAAQDFAPQDRRPLFDPKQGAFVQAATLQRDALAPGLRVAGPAVIVEEETTVIVPPDFSARSQVDGTLDIRRDREGGDR